VERPELEHAGVVKIVESALTAGERYKNVVDFGKALVGIYANPPVEKRPTPTRLYVVVGLVSLSALALVGVAGFLLLTAFRA
jgi:hypothetical protein